MSNHGIPSVHSSLYLWLRDHRETFAAAMVGSQGHRGLWKKHAARFARMGLRDDNGSPPSPETCRKNWYRVRKAWLVGKFERHRAPSPVVDKRGHNGMWEEFRENCLPAPVTLVDEAPRPMRIERASVRK